MENRKLRITEIVLFAVLGALMMALQIAMQALPNIHLTAVLIMSYTLVFRWKAIFPITVYLILDFIYQGATVYWIPYLYVWFILWGATMILPKKMPPWAKWVFYPLTCGLHGLLFGTLTSIPIVLLLGLGWEGVIPWIISGLPYDLIHGISNFVLGFLIIPISVLLQNGKKRLGI